MKVAVDQNKCVSSGSCVMHSSEVFDQRDDDGVVARAELQIVFTTLFRRIPTLRLAIPFDGVPFEHDRLAYGVYELPVSW